MSTITIITNLFFLPPRRPHGTWSRRLHSLNDQQQRLIKEVNLTCRCHLPHVASWLRCMFYLDKTSILLPRQKITHSNFFLNIGKILVLEKFEHSRTRNKFH